jgi:TPP-dependent pyruvate/acetoin dehydrogenase alpha subunit
VALTRKRRKELKRLKGQAEGLWNDQRELLEHASAVVREATHQAANYAREEVSPRFHDTIDSRLKPAVSSSIAGARSAAESTKSRIKGDVLPAVTSALGTALAALEVAKNQQVRDAFARVSTLGSTAGHKTSLVKAQPKSPGFGRYMLIGLSVVAAAGVAYAAWQTLRADDDLWIDDEAETIQR